ncbi:MAG: hypothetical protein H8F28_09615 [Fibrella sp.]|nr:hypothetical protein [Armatimonadota bacterium]
MSEPVAMILPLPVKRGTRENAVTFISLKQYLRFFYELDRLFEPPPPPPKILRDRSGIVALGDLEVVSVGDFEASFVPTIADFERLDPRFRMPEGAFDDLPEYADYGFAVFQLSPTPSHHGKPHAMAFSFPTRDETRLFYPTVHIHDGTVHATERFDHKLYAQWRGGTGGLLRRIFVPSPWKKSHTATKKHVQIDYTQGIVDEKLRVHRCKLNGKLPNRDTWLSPADLT